METHLLQDLAVVMAAAGAMTLLCHRFHQPVVIGYLLAGLLIGPYTPPVTLVSNLDSIHTMAELGLVFLLFSLGLEFNLPKIQKVGLSAGLAAVLEVAGMLGIGYLLGQVFGWSRTDSLFLGAILCISSTTIIVKVFMDFKMMEEKFTQVVFGILILEDVVAIAILSILSGLGPQGGPDTTLILQSFLRIGLFVILFLLLGLLLIPRFIHWVAEFKVKEVLGIVTLGLCLAGSLIAVYFKLSIALGAFLTGAVLAASKEIDRIEEWIHPVRDMFSAIFFVSAGMLIQPVLLWEYKVPILIITLATLFGKVVSGTVGSFAAGYDLKTSARVGMSMAQIGEFSFVIASLGLTLKVTSDFLYPLAVTVSSLTTLATPYLIKNSDRVVDSFLAVMPASVAAKLESFQLKRDQYKESKAASYGTAIFSKYLVRLGIYAAILVAVIFIAQIAEASLTGALLPVMWVVFGILCLPLFMNIAKYLNHVILLVVTKNKWILQRLNIHLFYNMLNGATLLVLGGIFLLAAYKSLPEPLWITGMGLLLFFLGKAFRKTMTNGRERLENILDQVIGLATSEPTRQAVLQSGDKTLLLFDITDQVTLPPESLSNYRTIRELRLRERAGASIVAIYREGQHIANPGPDLELCAHDVLVLLGNKDQLIQARNLILKTL